MINHGKADKPPLLQSKSGKTAKPACQYLYTRAEFRHTVRQALKRPPFSARERKRVKHRKRCRATRTRYVARRMRVHLNKAKRRYRFRNMGPRAYARHLLRRRPGQFPCLDKLVFKESGWKVKARNPDSGAYGLPQALPGGKMASHGRDWAWNPRTQLRWMISYCDGRYGSPCVALRHSQRVGWY